MKTFSRLSAVILSFAIAGCTTTQPSVSEYAITPANTSVAPVSLPDSRVASQMFEANEEIAMPTLTTYVDEAGWEHWVINGDVEGFVATFDSFPAEFDFSGPNVTIITDMEGAFVHPLGNLTELEGLVYGPTDEL